MPVHQRPNRERYRPSATTTLETIPALPISSALFKLKDISQLADFYPYASLELLQGPAEHWTVADTLYTTIRTPYKS